MINLLEAKQKAELLRNNAVALFEEKEILQMLSEYGEVKFVGSYAANLMVKPDIDMEIVNPTINSDKVIELTSAFFKMKDNYSVEIADGTDYIRRSGHPKGYYVGVNIMYQETRWHLDIWLTREPIDTSDSSYTSMRSHDWYKTVEPEKLDTILLLKHQLNEKDDYNKYASANVYESVLNGGVASLDEFYKWAETYDTDALFRRGNSKAT
ncbi:MAG: hypothetical protein ACR2FM_03325 [Candidatus Saccharimonadales bacterium]